MARPPIVLKKPLEASVHRDRSASSGDRNVVAASGHVHDVVIVGGGPAGSAAGRLLALWGYDVVLVTRGEDPERSLAVSVPPSARKLLREIGVLDAVDVAGFVRSTGNTVWWGGGEPRSERFAGGETGYQVRHAEFDRLLLAAAETAGTTVVRDATVVDVAVEIEPTCARYSSTAGEQEVKGRYVIDASGRQGVIARALEWHAETAPSRTVALIGTWGRETPWDLADDTHTLVESFAEGWAWSVPVSAGRRYFTCMIDPEVSELARGSLRQRYLDALGRTSAFSQLLDGAELEDEPWGCDASWYRAERVYGDRFLLVGDAASCIDPLSSFGVKKALASGWLAAVVINTWAQEPTLREAASALFADRERQMYDTFRSQAARFFETVADDHQHPFWTGRAGGADQETSDGDIDALRHDEEVLTAFEKLRNSRSIQLIAEPEVHVVNRPAIGDRRVVMEKRLATPALPGGLRFLRGVDVPRLMALAPDYEQVPDLFAVYNERCPPVPLPDFIGAVSVLLAKGFLRNDAA